MAAWLDRVRWNPDGLVPAIAQDAVTQRVLTLAWMNREALTKTVKTREVHYWSRSRAPDPASTRDISRTLHRKGGQRIAARCPIDEMHMIGLRR